MAAQQWTCTREQLIDAIAGIKAMVPTSGPAAGMVLADSTADAILAQLPELATDAAESCQEATVAATHPSLADALRLSLEEDLRPPGEDGDAPERPGAPMVHLPPLGGPEREPAPAAGEVCICSPSEINPGCAVHGIATSPLF